MPRTMRTGDTVRHIPSGETWIVAWPDEEELMWCGYPEGWAKISDCVLVKNCTDEQHWKLIKEIANGYISNPHGPGSVRAARCRHYLDKRLAIECAEMMHL